MARSGQKLIQLLVCSATLGEDSEFSGVSRRKCFQYGNELSVTGHRIRPGIG